VSFRQNCVCGGPGPEEGANSAKLCLVAKLDILIVAVLSCFDCVIVKGHLPISHGPALEGFVDHLRKIRRRDFLAFAQRQLEPWSTAPIERPTWRLHLWVDGEVSSDCQ
jgi:hypothetical protein